MRSAHGNIQDVRNYQSANDDKGDPNIALFEFFCIKDSHIEHQIEQAGDKEQAKKDGGVFAVFVGPDPHRHEHKKNPGPEIKGGHHVVADVWIGKEVVGNFVGIEREAQKPEGGEKGEDGQAKRKIGVNRVRVCPWF